VVVDLPTDRAAVDAPSTSRSRSEPVAAERKDNGDPYLAIALWYFCIALPAVGFWAFPERRWIWMFVLLGFPLVAVFLKALGDYSEPIDIALGGGPRALAVLVPGRDGCRRSLDHAATQSSLLGRDSRRRQSPRDSGHDRHSGRSVV